MSETCWTCGNPFNQIVPDESGDQSADPCCLDCRNKNAGGTNQGEPAAPLLMWSCGCCGLDHSILAACECSKPACLPGKRCPKGACTGRLAFEGCPEEAAKKMMPSRLREGSDEYRETLQTYAKIIEEHPGNKKPVQFAVCTCEPGKELWTMKFGVGGWGKWKPLTGRHSVAEAFQRNVKERKWENNRNKRPATGKPQGAGAQVVVCVSVSSRACTHACRQSKAFELTP